jgi:hypothetical protein
VPPPDFDRGSLRTWLDRNGYRSAITGKLVVLAGGRDWMASLLDRYPNADGPYMLGLKDPNLLNVRLVASEEQSRRVGGRLPESDDFRALFQFALDDIMDRTDLLARAAHVKLWEEALAEPKGRIHDFLRVLIKSQRSNDRAKKRDASTNVTVKQLVAKLRAIEFHDEHACAPIALEMQTFMTLSLDRVDNAKNHSAANVKAGDRLPAQRIRQLALRRHLLQPQKAPGAPAGPEPGAAV